MRNLDNSTASTSPPKSTTPNEPNEHLLNLQDKHRDLEAKLAGVESARLTDKKERDDARQDAKNFEEKLKLRAVDLAEKAQSLAKFFDIR